MPIFRRFHVLPLALLVGVAGCASLPGGALFARKSAESVARPSTDAAAASAMPLRVVSSDKVRAEACRQTAIELSKAGQDEPAVAQFQRARSFMTDLPGVAHPLAVCCDRLGRFDEARREYELALKETPRSAQLHNDFGMHFLQKEEWQTAEHYFRQALKHDAKHPRAWTNLGIALAEQARYDEAEQAFAKSATSAAAASNVAMFLAHHGRTADAEQKFRAALAHEPTLKPAIEGLAHLSPAASSGRAVLPAADFQN